MRELFFAVLLASMPCFAQEAPAALRARALELGGGLRDSGFVARDGFWSGKLEPGSPRSLAVTLFAGNRYVFCVATDGPAPKVSVRDSAGRTVDATSSERPGFAAAGVTPAASGRYFIGLEPAGKSPSNFCLVYFFH